MKPRVFLLLAVLASIVLASCTAAQAPQPQAPATPEESTCCPVHVKVDFGLDQDGRTVSIQTLMVKDFIVRSHFVTKTDVYSGNTYDRYEWSFNDDSAVAAAKWYKTDVKKLRDDIARRLWDAFGIGNVYEFEVTDLESDWPSFSDTEEAVCPVGDFNETIMISLDSPRIGSNDAFLQQSGFQDGRVLFEYVNGRSDTEDGTVTEKGSVLNFSVSVHQFMAIVIGQALRFDNAAEPVQMDYALYSQTLTDLVYTQKKTEIASFSMLPEDTKARGDIYELIRRLVQYTDQHTEFTFINTLINDKGGARLIGSVIQK